MSAIEIKNLEKSFKGFKAVDGLSISVAENRIYGFLGPNGAGKTTTIRTLVGLSKPSAGEIKIFGQERVFGDKKVNRMFGYLPETPSFYNWMTGREYLHFVQSLFGENDASEVKNLLSKVGLTESGGKRIGGYSNGMKQRLGIAQALVGNPKLLILDEPVSALDPIGRKEVLDIIEDLKKDKTIFMSTHILADVDRICDDIAILNKGKLVVESSLADLKAKYAQPIIEVEFEKDPKQFVAGLEKQPWVKKVVHTGRTIKIWPQNGDAIQTNEVLKAVSEFGIGVMSFGLKLPETEDLFLELVGETDA